MQNPASELQRADETPKTCRNGTKESIKSIVKGLNEAKLDSNVGMSASRIEDRGQKTWQTANSFCPRGRDRPSGPLPPARELRALAAHGRGCGAERLRQAQRRLYGRDQRGAAQGHRHSLDHPGPLGA